MPPIKRLNYFTNQFLVEADFTDEQKYHLEMRRRLNKHLHTFGIAEGLEVTKSGAKQIKVSPGLAIDRNGQETVLTEDFTIDLPLTASPEVHVTIAYRDFPDVASTATGVTGDTRITEDPKVEAVATTSTPSNGSVIILSKFEYLTANVPGVTGDPVPMLAGFVRKPVSASLADEDKGILSVDGVSNPGGNIDLVGGTGITVSPDQNNNTIRIDADAPPTQGIISIDGVTSPGGNVDLVEGTGISISPNPAAENITIGTSGLLLTSAYDLGQRAWVTIAFSESDTDGATRSAIVGFKPILILCVGKATATLAGQIYGGGISGIFDELSNEQHCFGIFVFRKNNKEWFSSVLEAESICISRFIREVGGASQREDLEVFLTSDTKGLTAKLTRDQPTGVGLASFDIKLNLLCMGPG